MPQSPDDRLVTETRLGQLGGGGSGATDLSAYATDAELANGLQGKADKATIDAATASPTVLSLMRRDAAGRTQVATPAAAGDAATKGYADALGAVIATPSTVVRRDTAGRFQTVDPAVAADVATKAYADTKVAQGAVAALSVKAETVGYMNHGTNASAARPVGYGAVFWFGTVEPINALPQDIWV
jgi:hypothetical protein